MRKLVKFDLYEEKRRRFAVSTNHYVYRFLVVQGVNVQMVANNVVLDKPADMAFEF